MIAFRNKFRVCDLFGIPIYLDVSFAFILLMFLFETPPTYGLAFALTLAVSIVLHELGHSLAAAAFGYRTNDITLSLLGGCASLIALPRKAWQEFLTALAGPLVSLALAGASWLLLYAPIESVWLLNVLLYASVMNLTLALFNFLPALPMDGGRIFRSALQLFVPRLRATFIAMVVGRVAAVLLVVLPLAGARHIGPIPIGGYFFMRLLIAWMIWREGYREYLLARMDSDFRNWTQDDFNARVSPPPYER